MILWNSLNHFVKLFFPGNCISSVDRTRHDEADAVIFDVAVLGPNSQWPSHTSSAQLYVVRLNQPASRSGVNKIIASRAPDYFNLSMTYRLDSHMPMRYINIFKLPTNKQKKLSTILDRVKRHPKKKLVAWFVSHCKTPGNRESYVKELQKHIDVDIYGKCGPIKCSNETKRPKYCYKMVENYYKFYLSFENSLCKDYVTEKLANILKHDIIPVTLGGVNYSERAPPNSYINALDFSSPWQLARYLKFLDENQTDYLKYFEWKPQYKVYGVARGISGTLCKLCALLNNKIPFVSHPDFLAWWNPPGTCSKRTFSYH